MHTEAAIHSMNAYVWCWRKACGSLDDIPSDIMGTCKRKFLMNSNMTLTVLNLHQQTDPKVQQDFKGQYSKVKGQSVSHHDMAHLKPSTNVPTKLENLISKLNFYKLISYLVDRCICPAHSRSRQTLEKNASSWALARTGSVLFTRQVAV